MNESEEKIQSDRAKINDLLLKGEKGAMGRGVTRSYVIEVGADGDDESRYIFDGIGTSLRAAKDAVSEWCDASDVYHLTWTPGNPDRYDRPTWIGRAFSEIGAKTATVWRWRITEIPANTAGVELS